VLKLLVGCEGGRKRGWNSVGSLGVLLDELVELAAAEVLHALSDQDLGAAGLQGKRHELHDIFEPPNYRLNVDFLLLRHDGLVHAARHLLGLERGQDKAHSGAESFE